MPNEPQPSRADFRATPAKSSGLVPSVGQPVAAKAIAEAGQMVQRVLRDRPLLSFLASRGIDVAQIQQGLTLHSAAEQSLEAAESLFVAVEEAASTRAFTFAAARNDYADFRRAIKAACNSDGRGDALDASQYPRQSVRRFVAQATASYLAAFKTVPIDLIAEQGFDLNRLNLALARVRRLLILDTWCNARTRQANHAAGIRDHALVRLNTWVGELLATIQLALAPNPPPPSTRRRARRSPSPPAKTGDASHTLFHSPRILWPNSHP